MGDAAAVDVPEAELREDGEEDSPQVRHHAAPQRALRARARPVLSPGSRVPCCPNAAPVLRPVLRPCCGPALRPCCARAVPAPRLLRGTRLFCAGTTGSYRVQ